MNVVVTILYVISLFMITISDMVCWFIVIFFILKGGPLSKWFADNCCIQAGSWPTYSVRFRGDCKNSDREPKLRHVIEIVWGLPELD